MEYMEDTECFAQDDEPYSSDKVYCANCSNCKIVRTLEGNGTQYYLRVRCAAGKWLKKLGGEKFYKYFTVARRSLPFCDSYIPMGEPKEYIKELKNTLPIRDELYQ